MTANDQSVERRIRKLRKDLGLTGTEMAERLQRIVGTKTTPSRVSEWERAKPEASPETLAALSLLHPLDPRGCLKWLREGGEMPRLHVDRNERGSDVHQPELNRAEALEAVNRFAVELAEILRRDDQQPPEENGPAPEPAPEPRRPRVTSTDLAERKRKLKEARGVGDREEEE